MQEENLEFIGPMPQKICSVCHGSLLLRFFRKKKGASLGVSNGCKSCLNKIGKEKYISRKEDPYIDSRYVLEDGFSGPVVQKRCSVCEEPMTLDKFHKHHSSRFNRNSKCIECQSAITVTRNKTMGAIYNKRGYDKQTPERRLELNGQRQRLRKG